MITRTIVGVLSACAVAALASICHTQARAQSSRTKPIRMIVPYAAGGIADALARAVAGPLSDTLGQPVITENRPGASSIIGMQTCANAEPDGNTLCVTNADSVSYNPQLFSKLPYDPDKSFEPIINLGLLNAVLATYADAPFNDYEEMIRYAKVNPGKLNWGTWGAASTSDLYYRWATSHSGVNIVPVPYRGAGPILPALMAREVDIAFVSASWLLAQPDALKPLAIVGNRRSSLMPTVRSLDEQGGDPGLQSFFGVWAPVGVPSDSVRRLHNAFESSIIFPNTQTFYKNSGLEFVPNSSDDFRAFTRRDRIAAATFFKSMGIEPSAIPQ